MKTLNLLKAFISTLIVWVIGVTAFLTSYYIPILNDPDIQANWALTIMLVPATILGAHLYYRKGQRTNGFLLGTFMFLITILLDAIITVPLFIIPAGGNHLTFFLDPSFWLIGLEYITIIIMYWLARKTIQNNHPVQCKTKTMKTQLIIITAITTFLMSCSLEKGSEQANTNKHELFKSSTDSLMNNSYKNGGFMGSLALEQQGTKIYSNAFGYSDFENKRKSNTNTQYNIASITKTFTAVLVFKAIEENKLELNQTIGQYFPDVKNAEKITLAHLLHHRSGIHSYTDENFMEFRLEYHSQKDILKLISSFESDFEPGTKAAYSNSNYFLLGMILEKTYDLPYSVILQEKIATPLGLSSTYSTNSNTPKMTKSYEFTTDWKKFEETNMSVTLGAGSIISTPSDLNKFIKALLTEKIISKENLNKMKTIKDSYGMGLFRYKIIDRVGYGHRGGIDAFQSTSIYFPEEDLAFTIISNGGTTDLNELYSEILNQYFDDAPKEISEADVKKFVGVYSSPDSETKPTFIQDGNNLIHVIKNEFKETLIYRGNNRFVLEQMYGESISFTFTEDGKELTFEQGNYKGKYVKYE